MAGLDIDTLNTELKVKTCIFTCRYSSNMGRLIEVRPWKGGGGGPSITYPINFFKKYPISLKKSAIITKY